MVLALPGVGGATGCRWKELKSSRFLEARGMGTKTPLSHPGVDTDNEGKKGVQVRLESGIEGIVEMLLTL